MQSQWVFVLAQELNSQTRGISARTGHGADLATASSLVWGGELPPSENSSVVTAPLPCWVYPASNLNGVRLSPQDCQHVTIT